MDLIVFIGVIACLALVVGWHLVNEMSKRDGEAGILSLRPGTRGATGEEEPEARYRMAARLKPRTQSERLAPIGDKRRYRMRKRPRDGGDDE